MVINTRLDWEQWGKRRIPLPPSYPPLLSKITNASSFEVLSPSAAGCFLLLKQNVSYSVKWLFWGESWTSDWSKGLFPGCGLCTYTSQTRKLSQDRLYPRNAFLPPPPLPHNGWEPCKMLVFWNPPFQTINEQNSFCGHGDLFWRCINLIQVFIQMGFFKWITWWTLWWFELLA